MSDENMAAVSQAANADERLLLLQEEDLQCWLERAKAMGKHMHVSSSSENMLVLRPSQTPVTCERLIEEACAIGNQLYRRAIKSDGIAVWMGPTLITKTVEWAP